LNNHFGIVGKNNLMKTKKIKTMYKQYNSVNESYYDFMKLICRKKYYLDLKGNSSCEKWVKAMSLHGYSTQPESWRKVIMNTIAKMD
jgi:flagellum-specific peptidoglycan hydrolase FlgJ